MDNTSTEGRTIKGLLIRPGSQVKTFFYAAGLGQVILSGVFIGYLSFIEYALPEAVGEGSPNLAGILNSLFWVKMVILLLTAIVLAGSFSSIVLFTHRVLGPCVPILRLIEKLKNGQYGEQGRLRKDDELKNVMSALNELSTELKKKSGN